jgi:hypothetical protein
MASKKKYIAVNTIIHGDAMAGKKAAPKTYRPGETFDADADDAEIKRLVQKGAIKEQKVVEAEQAERREALREQAVAKADATADATETGTTSAGTSAGKAGGSK